MSSLSSLQSSSKKKPSVSPKRVVGAVPNASLIESRNWVRVSPTCYVSHDADAHIVYAVECDASQPTLSGHDLIRQLSDVNLRVDELTPTLLRVVRS